MYQKILSKRLVPVRMRGPHGGIRIFQRWQLELDCGHQEERPKSGIKDQKQVHCTECRIAENNRVRRTRETKKAAGFVAVLVAAEEN